MNKPTKFAGKAEEAVKRVHPEWAPLNAWTPHPITAAIESLDCKISAKEAVWGVDVLPFVVSPQTAAKYASAKEKADRAVVGTDVAEAIKRIDVMDRAYRDMELEALERGHKPGDPSVWMAGSDEHGNRFVMFAHEAEAKMAAKNPKWDGYSIWSFPEFMRLANHHSLEAVLAAKRMFPDAVVERVKPDPDWTKGDEVGL